MNKMDTYALACLDALVSEAHVTRAAQRVGIGQPAMSEMLAKLRVLFNDPLLVRARQGMMATPRAIEAAKKARAALRLIDDAISGAEGDAAESKSRILRIVAVNSLAFSLLPRLVYRFQQVRPHTRFVIEPGDVRRTRELLEANACDMVIGYPPVVSGSLHATTLYKYKLCCIVRQKHPEIGSTISLKQFVAYPHVALGAGALPISTIETAVEKALRDRRMQRIVAVRVPDLLISSAVVAETDCVAVIPEPIARRFQIMMGLSVLNPPIPLPDPKILMIWHERSHRDPDHRWARRQIQLLAKQP